MILPTFTEEQILSELIEDYKRIKRIVKKKADGFLLKAQKSGRYIKETDYESYTIKTGNNNTWIVEIEYNQTNKIPWLFRTCCIVESDKNTKDFFIVRGLNTEKPYFVKVTSHAVKRAKERNKLDKFKVGLGTFACYTFEHKEIGICIRYADIKFNQLLQEMDDSDELHDMSYMVIVRKGVYYAKKTPNGNYIFKTYLSVSMGMDEIMKLLKKKSSKWENEGKLLSFAFIMHQYYNRELYSKEALESMLYRTIGKDKNIELRDKGSVTLLRK